MCACTVDDFHVLSKSALLWDADLRHTHRLMRFFLNCRPGHALCEVGRGVVMDNSLVSVEEGGGPANPKKLGNFTQNVVWGRRGNTKGDYLGLLGLLFRTHCFQFVYMYYFHRLLDYHSYGLVFPVSIVDCKKIVGVCYIKRRVKALYCSCGRRLQSIPFYMGQSGARSVDLLW